MLHSKLDYVNCLNKIISPLKDYYTEGSAGIKCGNFGVKYGLPTGGELVKESTQYWLEEKHIDDRPYPLTGKLFAEGTPWGAVLNPTIGEIIKPVRMLPEIKKRLGNDGRDIRTVVEGINNRIKSK